MKNALFSFISICLLVFSSAAFSADAGAAININQATAVEIAEALDGVGESRAGAIVAYREAHGEFKSIEELGDVKGIGDMTLKANESRIKL